MAVSASVLLLQSTISLCFDTGLAQSFEIAEISLIQFRQL